MAGKLLWHPRLPTLSVIESSTFKIGRKGWKIKFLLRIGKKRKLAFSF